MIERLFLGFHSYTDYTDIHKLSDALGSPPWLASGFGHLVTGVAVIVLGVNLSRWMLPTRPRLSEYARYATGVAAVLHRMTRESPRPLLLMHSCKELLLLCGFGEPAA